MWLEIVGIITIILIIITAVNGIHYWVTTEAPRVAECNNLENMYNYVNNLTKEQLDYLVNDCK